MSGHYILDGTTPRKVELLEWARWLETAERKVAYTEIAPHIGISTVFLGLDHSFGGGPPQIFETLVMGGPLDEEMDRYSTWEEAEAGHRNMVKKCRAALARRNE